MPDRGLYGTSEAPHRARGNDVAILAQVDFGALRSAAWTTTISAVRWRAFWAGVKHDVGALLRRQPDVEGHLPAWDPSIPKGMASYGPGSRRRNRPRHH